MPSRLLSLAFFLPQFHGIRENDAWWGPGFTEWTQLNACQCWYPEHRIRHPIPPLGQYNLLDPATLQAQGALARSHNIDGFLVWNYWFGEGRQLLERPTDLLHLQDLDVNYAFAWANHDWVDKLGNRLLMKQRYLGEHDYEAYFLRCLPHFLSRQYVKLDGKPFFFIYRPQHLPDLPVFLRTWRRLALQHGLPGLYLVGDLLGASQTKPPGLDAYSCTTCMWANRPVRGPSGLSKALLRRVGAQRSPQRFDFLQIMRGMAATEARHALLHTVFSGWDTTPRHGRNGVIVDGLDNISFRAHLNEVKAQLDRTPTASSVVLVKSWNEWAEGNLLEPDSVHGIALLEEYRAFASSWDCGPSGNSAAPPA